MKKTFSILLALAMLLSLAACGAAAPSSAFSRSAGSPTVAETAAGTDAEYSEEAAAVYSYGCFAMNAAAPETSSAGGGSG